MDNNNFLNSGSVLPHGLLGNDEKAMLQGFAKSYKNFALRVGVIITSYPTKDENNKSKLTTEYDVLVVEQNEDKGATTIMYRNCMSAEGLGSIADFFEKALRPKKKKTRKGDSVDLKGQNGAIVLMLCLDGMSDKGIIIGALTHPDRKTTLKDEGPYLEGEYNGVNIKVEKDGSCTLVFKGATDNDGKIIDSTQGNTTVKIEKDGSYQVDHKTIKQRFDKNGKASLTADDDISNTTKKNFKVDATENVQVNAVKNYELTCKELIEKAEGSATLECMKQEIKAESEIKVQTGQFQMEAESLAKIKASQTIIEGLVNLGGAGGQNVLILSTKMFGIGNLGRPVMSQAIAGFAIKVTAQ